MYKYEKTKCSTKPLNLKFMFLDFLKKLKKQKKEIFGDKKNFNAIKFLILCLLIMASAVSISAAIGAFRDKNNVFTPEKYDELILPVVMQNPPNFDEKHPLSDDVMAEASIWKLAMEKNKNAEYNPSFFDHNQNLILDYDDVSDACFDLFGREFNKKNLKNISGGFYFFDSKNNKFIVKSVSGVSCPLGKTVNITKRGNYIQLEVEYIIPSEQFGKDMKLVDSPKIDNRKIYELKSNRFTGDLYISAIKDFKLEDR